LTYIRPHVKDDGTFLPLQEEAHILKWIKTKPPWTIPRYVVANASEKIEN
jgi:hypothetical protein